MTAPVLAPYVFDAPPVNPAPNGLFAATDWQPEGDQRWLNGVEVRGTSFGGKNAFGIWPNDNCVYGSTPTPGQKKEGDRPEIIPPFDPIVVWAYDECDPTDPSRAEVRARAANILRLEEQTAIEREFGNRLLVDAGVLWTDEGYEARPTLKEAVAYLEGQLSTLSYLHIAADLPALEAGLFTGSGTQKKSPAGHTWVIGSGYVEGLNNTIVATSQPYGWRDAPTVREALDAKTNTFAAVAERTVVIGYEALIAAVTITP
ncbi:hypothetical protein I5G58_gp018 [Mycobacterium phage BirdsNest]|uniref:Major capsid pentamer protein n=1 Tax=Mycobacterium phage BirdsNest TaxID=2686231 RepID=A0A6B9L778_9CAUD|nr:hypothetical protein I5G58_gp018 [Mycobacterium phage BirdsNest]QHB37320.1 major capsid pentamer protein [Mycobacterium phage BirdsNest]